MATELEGSNDQFNLTIEQRFELSKRAAYIRGVSRTDLENAILELLANGMVKDNAIGNLREAVNHYHQFTIALGEWLKLMAARSGVMTTCLIEAANALSAAGLDVSGFKILVLESAQTTEAIEILVNNLEQSNGG